MLLPINNQRTVAQVDFFVNPPSGLFHKFAAFGFRGDALLGSSLRQSKKVASTRVYRTYLQARTEATAE
jgi:hypothetical protein